MSKCGCLYLNKELVPDVNTLSCDECSTLVFPNLRNNPKRVGNKAWVLLTLTFYDYNYEQAILNF